jgi:hypothetical protein
MEPTEYKWNMYLTEEYTEEGQFFNRKILEQASLGRAEKKR